MNDYSHDCMIFLKNGSTISTNIDSLVRFMDNFYSRSFFKKTVTVVRFNGTPITCVPIDQISFFTVKENETI